MQESHELGDKTQPSNIYGIVHLLRLMSMFMFILIKIDLCVFVLGQLGTILAYSPLEQTEVDFLLVHIDDFNR